MDSNIFPEIGTFEEKAKKKKWREVFKDKRLVCKFTMRWQSGHLACEIRSRG